MFGASDGFGKQPLRFCGETGCVSWVDFAHLRDVLIQQGCVHAKVTGVEVELVEWICWAGLAGCWGCPFAVEGGGRVNEGFVGEV